ncbi:MAG: alpha/beta fold hydrolase [Propionicimonas sp.]|uniref:alpha/beta fold hydrolase n=1 Tax=Propionicimonas sp. TaxID=1955623 RepID=UPI002B2077C0|nr:alpha/beta fold hydrolase [Propionicimonas sp.]MEA4943064.1 alpha/beta fold hydrolase [Propionicimonas sp.]MEA5052628.1 alpha/beta fold hydrolase [Propionicimonas sp.]
MRTDPLYPPLEPYAHGWLDVGDGQRLYWEECGNPDGLPAVFVHGGPGGGLAAVYRRYFDPARYRVVLFDQRNCGRSTPHASEPAVDLSTNTTWHLVADLEKLRADRGIDAWLVFGGSWGSSLALAYAETHPDRVTALVLRGIFTLRRSELDWYYNGGAGNLAPAWWRSFEAPLLGAHEPFDAPWPRGQGTVPATSELLRRHGGDRIAAYHELLFAADPAVHVPAAQAWTSWETATSHLVLDQAAVEESLDPEHAVAFARIENHYFVHGGWFAEGQLLQQADRLRQIPAVIVQGAYDLPCPVRTADDLHRVWPEADYRVVLAGHSITEPEIAAELVAATDRFAASAG